MKAGWFPTHHVLRHVFNALGQRAAEVSRRTPLRAWSRTASVASGSVVRTHGLHARLWKTQCKCQATVACRATEIESNLEW